jgi:hypothetical protein
MYTKEVFDKNLAQHTCIMGYPKNNDYNSGHIKNRDVSSIDNNMFEVV